MQFESILVWQVTVTCLTPKPHDRYSLFIMPITYWLFVICWHSELSTPFNYHVCDVIGNHIPKVGLWTLKFRISSSHIVYLEPLSVFACNVSDWYLSSVSVKDSERATKAGNDADEEESVASDDDDHDKLNRASSNGHMDSPRKVWYQILYILSCIMIYL